MNVRSLGEDVKKGNLIFLGTGSSDGIPRVSCLTNPNETCKVCESAKNPDSKTGEGILQ